MRLIDLSNNQLVEQPSDIGEKYLRAGTHTVNANDDFFVIDPLTEEKKRVSGNELFSALQSGSKLIPDALINQSAEDEAYDDADIRAGALAILRGATGGLSDQVLVKGLGVKPEVLAKLKQNNPYLEMGGQMVGTIAPFVLPALGATTVGGKLGLATAAKIGEYTAAPLIARAGLNTERVAQTALKGILPSQKSKIADAFVKYGSRISGSAVEGMFYGGGQFISENALGNPEASGENLFAKGAKFAGEGALIGGTLALGTQIAMDSAGGFLKLLDRGIPKAMRTYFGVDEETTLKYLSNPKYYDAQEYTLDSISKEINRLATTTRSKLDKGILDIDDLDSAIKTLKEEAIDRKSQSIDIYKGLEADVKEWRKQQFKNMADENIPLELVQEIKLGKDALKQRIIEDNDYIDNILTEFTDDTPIVKTDNFLRKLKGLKKEFFTRSRVNPKEYVPVSMEEKKGLDVIDSYINMTNKFKESGYNVLTLKELRDYTKKIRKDIDFIGTSEFHNDKINALLNVYQDYLKKALQARAPMEFEVVMENMRRNVETMGVLNKQLKNDEKIGTFIMQNTRDMPRARYLKDYLNKLDTEIGTNIVPQLENYSTSIQVGRRPSPEEIKLMETNAPSFNKYIQSGVEAEGLQKFTPQQLERLGGVDEYNQIKLELGAYYPLAFRTQAQMAGEAAQKGEFEILNKYKGYLGEDINTYLEKLNKSLDRQKEIEIKLQNKNLKSSEVTALQSEMKKLKQYEDLDHAAKIIDQATRGNQLKIKGLFGKISKLSDQDFVEQIDYLRVNNSFEKAFPGKSSRNVNLWGLMIGGGAGTIGGGFIGGAIGSVIGSMVDYYGPTMAKAVLKGWSKVRGNLTIQKVYKVLNEEIPQVQKAYNDISLETLKSTEDANKAINKKIFNAPSDYIRKTIVPVYIKGTQPDFEENKEKVESWISAKDEVAENFYQDNDIFWQVAPNTASAYFKTYQRAVDFIDKKVPRGTNDYFNEYEPSDSEKYRFNKYVSYIENPSAIIDEIRSGSIPQQGVEVLQQVYPNMYGSLVDSFVENINKNGIKDVPFHKRVELKTKLGIDLVPNLNSNVFVTLQQNNQQAEELNKVNSKMSSRTQTDLLRISNKA